MLSVLSLLQGGSKNEAPALVLQHSMAGASNLESALGREPDTKPYSTCEGEEQLSSKGQYESELVDCLFMKETPCALPCNLLLLYC
jgi:hypothetical protein